MAARLNPRNQQCVRERIRATQLVNALENHVLGKGRHKGNNLSQSQVTAALGLLKKCVPDLAQTTVSNPDGTPLNFTLLVPPKAA